jgi:phage tail-like protein
MTGHESTASYKKKNPYQGYRFLVELEGLTIGGFSEVSGLSAETKVAVVKEGGVNDHQHKVPEATEYGNLILKRGITDSRHLWKWYRDVVMGKVARKNIFVILLDAAGNESWRWMFSNAYPVKWTGPDLKADLAAVALESVEIAHDGIS